MHITLYTFQTQYVNTALKKKKKKSGTFMITTIQKYGMWFK